MQQLHQAVSGLGDAQQAAFVDLRHALETLATTCADVNQRVYTLSAQLTERDAVRAAEWSAGQAALEERITQQGAAHKKLVADLEDTIHERTEALGVMQGMLVTVIVLVVTGIAIVWFKR